MRLPASMRPRRIRRGMNLAAGVAEFAGEFRPASMRPRRIRRGMDPGRIGGELLPNGDRLGFNEAPANSPGNARRCRAGFNEAPAIRRKERPVPASMRPRRIRRGMRFATTPSRAHPDTTSTGFNEAPANSPGNARTRRPVPIDGVASMRPRRIRRGMACRRSHGDAPVTPRASMRPRRIRRGMLEREWRPSMRPRRIRRGMRSSDALQ